MSAASRQRERRNGAENKAVAAQLLTRANARRIFRAEGKRQRCLMPNREMYGSLENGQIVNLTKLGMKASIDKLV